MSCGAISQYVTVKFFVYNNELGKVEPNILFEPVIVSGLMSDINNPDDPSPKYKGILTAQSEWLTDSCGVGEIQIVPGCIPGEINEVNLLIHSGVAAKMITIKVDGRPQPISSN
jgi:hypothetical protein